MKPHNLNMNKLATELRVTVTRIAEICHERRGITTDAALRLAHYLNTSAAFWVNLQWRYELGGRSHRPGCATDGGRDQCAAVAKHGG